MSQKVSKVKAVDSKNAPSGSGQQLQKVWSYVRYLYSQNEQIWQRCAQYEKDITELRNKIPKVA